MSKKEKYVTAFGELCRNGCVILSPESIEELDLHLDCNIILTKLGTGTIRIKARTGKVIMEKVEEESCQK